MAFFKSSSFKLLAALLFLLVCYNALVVNHNKDFDIFIQASQAVFGHQPCYEVWFHSGDSGLKYFYSPLFAVLLFPLKDAPQLVYNSVWFLFSLFFIYRIFFLLKYFLPLEGLSEKKIHLFYLLAVISCLRFVLDNLDLGQMTFFLVWGSAESMRLAWEKKWLGCAALLAFIINVKVIPIALFAYFVYRGQWKIVLGTVFFTACYFLLPALFLGFDFNFELHRQWIGSLTDTSKSSIFDDDCRPGFSSWIPSLLMDTKMQFGIRRNFLQLGPEQVKLVLNFLRALLLLPMVYLFGKPFRERSSKKNLFYDLALLALVTPVFFPHQGKYAIFYLLLPYAYCLYVMLRLHPLRSKDKCKKRFNVLVVLLGLSFALVTLTTDGLIGKRLRDLTEYLHFITYGVIALLAAMYMLRPKAT